MFATCNHIKCLLPESNQRQGLGFAARRVISPRRTDNRSARSIWAHLRGAHWSAIQLRLGRIKILVIGSQDTRIMPSIQPVNEKSASRPSEANGQLFRVREWPTCTAHICITNRPCRIMLPCQIEYTHTHRVSAVSSRDISEYQMLFCVRNCSENAVQTLNERTQHATLRQHVCRPGRGRCAEPVHAPGRKEAATCFLANLNPIPRRRTTSAPNRHGNRIRARPPATGSGR